jgi:hypothetical protein
MLTTVTRLQAELKNTAKVMAASVELAAIIVEVSWDLASRCNREFYYASNVVEYVAGFASTNLQVSKHCPIDVTPPATVAVTFDGGPIDPNVYTIPDPGLGFIYNRTGWYWTASLLPNVQQDPFAGYENRLYQITYSGGWVTPQQALDNPADPILSVRTLPFDIERACLLCCVMWYRMQAQNPLFKSERLMSYSYTLTESMEIPFVEGVVARRRRTGMSGSA